MAALSFTFILRHSIGVSFFLCSLLTLTLAAVQTPEAVIGVEAAFNAVFAVGLASLTVASTETCPTYIRFALFYSLLNAQLKCYYTFFFEIAERQDGVL